jgi:hypothetical protein
MKRLPITDDPLRVLELVIEYFGKDEIPEWLNADIRLRDSAKAALSKAKESEKSKLTGQ